MLIESFEVKLNIPFISDCIKKELLTVTLNYIEVRFAPVEFTI
jgi:hypothetical protein